MKTVYVLCFELFHYGHIRLLKKCEDIAYIMKIKTREPVRLLRRDITLNNFITLYL